ncbi:hypothetical protein ACQKEK_02515 [Pseudomonas sp. NPDC077408]|uniref:hypothetical protein n=1 Tax=Streptomyces parvus TaxID=66428 RepID=UPI003717C0D1
MDAFYDRMAATALRLLKKRGQSVVLRDTAPGEYDPITGGSTPGAVAEQIGSAYLGDYSLRESGAANLAGSDIRQNDKKIMLAAGDIRAPTLSTKILADVFERNDEGELVYLRTDTWTAVNIKEINPAGTPLVYEIQGRR